MTIESWKAEFYPVPAAEVVKRTELEQAKHALLKWTGAMPENLQKHGLRKALGLPILLNQEDELYSSKPAQLIFTNFAKTTQFRFTTEECVWCHNHYKSGGCEGCPLLKHTGKKCENRESAFVEFIHTGDPSIMIKAINEVITLHENEDEA